MTKKDRPLPLLKLAAVLLVFFAFGGCNYERMNDQDSVRTYERKMTAMDKRTVPLGDSYRVLSLADPKGLENPLPESHESLERGRLAYGYFCVQCHGPRLDGKGTVGQSFAPLPSDLLSRSILSRTDGELYAHIRLGFLRHPALFSTVSAEDAWATILYMRSLKKGGS